MTTKVQTHQYGPKITLILANKKYALVSIGTQYFLFVKFCKRKIEFESQPRPSYFVLTGRDSYIAKRLATGVNVMGPIK